MTQFGISPQGFVPKQQQQIIADINSALQATFGANLNLGAESILGQLVGVFSEREALLWQLAEAVYASQYPGGAEGTSVDNILALNNLKRLAASATTTDPTPATQTNGLMLYGLVLYGQAGTLIPAGSQVKTSATPPITLTLDADVTISAASNGSQNIILSNTPTAGTFSLGLVAPAGNVLTTPAIQAAALANQSQLIWSIAPSSGSMILMIAGKALPPIDSNYSAGGLQALLQSLGGIYASATVAGSFAAGFVISWAANTFQPIINAAPTILTLSATPTTGSFTLSLGGVLTASLPASTTASQLQAALVASGYPRALVSSVVPAPTNLLPGNVRTGTDAGQSTAGFLGCKMDGGFSTSGAPTLASSSAQAFEGSSSLFVICAEGYRYGACVRASVVAGTQYTFSFYARAFAGSVDLITGVNYNVSGGSLSGITTVNATAWTRISVVVTIPTGQSVAQFSIGEATDTSAQFYLDAFQLETAASASAWADTAGIPGFAINWIDAAPAVSVAANSLSSGSPVILSVASGYSYERPISVLQSLQASISNLYDAASGKRPFTDIALSAAGSVSTISFGAMAPQAGEPSTAGIPEPLITVASNSLTASGTAINIAVSLNAAGSAAQGIGSATATITGPNAILAGQISVIGSPVSNWTGVINQLDAIPGTNIESDTEALLRRSHLLAASAKGPLQSIIERVSISPGVSTAIGFANTTAAALQTLSFASQPSSGSYRLVVGGGLSPIILYISGADGVQAALNAIPGYAGVIVSGGVALGMSIDFNGSQGAQWQPLIQVIANTTGVAIQASYGRAPKSFEIVVQGGNNNSIAQTIYDSMPAGIASYGTPAAQVLGSTIAGSTTLTVASGNGIIAGQSIFGAGVPSGALVGGISGTAVTMSAAALRSVSTTPILFNNSGRVTDPYGNPVVINFSRPLPVLFYVSIALITDQYRTAGNPASGVNPLSRFSPGSIASIQADIVKIGNATPIGGLVIGAGSGGLLGAFNEVAGIVGYTLSFGIAPSPSASDNIQLAPTQIATFEAFNVTVSWT